MVQGGAAVQRLEGLVRKAVQDYDMIAAGDRICVGVSGGKDSVALTVALGHLRRYLGEPEVLAGRIVNPERIVVLAPGQPWTLRRL